jgi:polyphenol oxidase
MTIGALTSSMLSVPGIAHAFFTREGGVSDGLYASLNGGQGSDDDAANVAENRARMAAHLGVPSGQLISGYQIHSPDVAIVEEPWTRDNRPRVDALVTNRPGIALGVTTADCGPILFVDPEAQVIGAAHAGWKGAIGGVLENTLLAMEKLGARREKIRVALGMMISQENYEVGPEFVDQFIKRDKAFATFFRDADAPQKALFDLPGFISNRLGALGIGLLDDLALCTYADEARFYSYRRTTHRRESDYGRHISAIMLGS